MWIRAAERLGCSVFDLISRPDLDYWLSCVAALNEYEQWQLGKAR